MDNHTDRFAVAKGAVDLRTVCDANLTRMGKSYVCPCCGSGTKANGTPAFSLKGERWKCFSCNNGGDVFDLVGILNDTTDRGEQLRIVQRMAGIPEGAGNPVPTGKGEAMGWSDTITDATLAERPKKPIEEHAEGRKRHAAYIDRCEAAMVEGCAGWTYLIARGLTPDTIKRHRLGYDERRRAVVMPYSDKPGEYYHIERAIDLNTHTKGKYRKPKSDEVGAEPLFWPSDLTAPVLFVVEGTMDAYAVHQAGYPAVAVVSAKSYRPIVNRLTESHYDGTVCVMLDDDATGNEAADGLAAELDAAQILNVRVKQAPGCKDAGEALETKPEELAAVLADAHRAAEELAAAERDNEYRESLASLHIKGSAEILSELESLENPREPIPTGIAALDAALEGGFRPGVVVLGAVSSLGKTTLMVQVADNMAEAGFPVLFVSIEQGAGEIVGKSITRLTAEEGARISGYDLTSGRRRDRWDDATREAFARACSRYREDIAPNLLVSDAIGRPKVNDIRRVADMVTARCGRSPVVFIDYLQLLKSEDPRATEKQTADEAVTLLRQMASSLNTVVVVVSSLNRASYSGIVSMDSFKESGGIEYGADVALGLEPAGIADKLDATKESQRASFAKELVDQEKRKPMRELEIAILKNRNGAMPDAPVVLTMDARAGRFTSGYYRGEPMNWS